MVSVEKSELSQNRKCTYISSCCALHKKHITKRAWLLVLNEMLYSLVPQIVKILRRSTNKKILSSQEAFGFSRRICFFATLSQLMSYYFPTVGRGALVILQS